MHSAAKKHDKHQPHQQPQPEITTDESTRPNTDSGENIPGMIGHLAQIQEDVPKESTKNIVILQNLQKQGPQASTKTRNHEKHQKKSNKEPPDKKTQDSKSLQKRLLWDRGKKSRGRKKDIMQEVKACK